MVVHLVGILALYLCYRFIKWWHFYIDKLNENHLQQIKYEVPDVIPERKETTLEA